VAGAGQQCIEHGLASVISPETAQAFRLEKPRLHRGLIASGDQFIGKRGQVAQLKAALPALLAVEMEGAAVAQVCFELGIPFAVIRTISDKANEDAATDFMHFVKTVASPYAFDILRRFCHAE
jgi:adenosylhomocysteine nucleosidase